MAFVEMPVSEAVAKAAQELGIACTQDPVWKSWRMKFETSFFDTRDEDEIVFEDEDEILKLYVSNGAIIKEFHTIEIDESSGWRETKGIFRKHKLNPDFEWVDM